MDESLQQFHRDGFGNFVDLCMESPIVGAADSEVNSKEIVPDSISSSLNGKIVESMDNVIPDVVKEDMRIVSKFWCDDKDDSDNLDMAEDNIVSEDVTKTPNQQSKDEFTKVLSKSQKKKLKKNKKAAKALTAKSKVGPRNFA